MKLIFNHEESPELEEEKEPAIDETLLREADGSK